MSQRHAGWVAVPDLYDDGGLSGGTMERPALRRLLADITAGKVKIVVVYKVDRLTRSLSDFAKIVDVLDAHDASFVSVTQQFNTTTSMGRLTSLMRLSYLAPDLVADMLAGRQPPELSVKRLLRTSRYLPLDWSEQRRFLGFG